MAKFNPKEVEEINETIAAIGKKLKPKMEIGSRDKGTLTALLGSKGKGVIHFKCRREHSEAILNHFVNEKNVPKNKYSQNAQANIYLIAPSA
jgi:hypothetical protein